MVTPKTLLEKQASPKHISVIEVRMIDHPKLNVMKMDLEQWDLSSSGNYASSCYGPGDLLESTCDDDDEQLCMTYWFEAIFIFLLL
ncbi:hypothetical protein FNV43_RR24359 [Rhamnella rubrinervis]|uniref:Uncharacterized protein n=1 Tax=Rhamnella rubrinervis TaxID=2594499 RepID=A0A8K0GL48_9ROSA|nr:hypothetical protein FNV43_RR24359 [Rhamnella rubrinervis]